MRSTSIVLALAAAVTAQSGSPNDACSVQPYGYAPPTPGPATLFQLNPAYSLIAQSASTPANYTRSFVNLQGSTSQAGYIGFSFQQSYSPASCAALCQSVNGCVAFNTYIERDPLLAPAPACPDPFSTAQYKCSLWSSPVSAATAVNVGQTRERFQVVIAGSNGKSCSGFMCF